MTVNDSVQTKLIDQPLLSNPRTRRTETILDMAIILVWPIVLLLISNAWIFTSVTHWVDPWYYVGYFMDIPAHYHKFPGIYYGTRLSYIVPGHIIYSIFTPLVANYI